LIVRKVMSAFWPRRGIGAGMRTPGNSAELERRRRLAVRRLRQGFSTSEVAAFLEVDPRSVRRWAAACSESGSAGLASRAAPGRPGKLDYAQEKVVHRWLAQSPQELGFATDLWTTRRLATLIRDAWGVAFNARYLCDWLGRRGYTPQKPQRVPRERDERLIRGWRRRDWPRIQKKCVTSGEA
jgi:transposase